MPEHHHQDETYFGEDYYDEDAEESVDSDLARNDPYAEADRMARGKQSNPYTFHKEFTDEYDKKPNTQPEFKQDNNEDM